VAVLTPQMARQFENQTKIERPQTPTGTITSFVKSEPKVSVLCRDTIETEILDSLRFLIGDDTT